MTSIKETNIPLINETNNSNQILKKWKGNCIRLKGMLEVCQSHVFVIIKVSIVCTYTTRVWYKTNVRKLIEPPTVAAYPRIRIEDKY